MCSCTGLSCPGAFNSRPIGRQLNRIGSPVRQLCTQSVRKVLGASLPDPLVLLVGDFTKLIVLAVILASPVAWWIMDKWLENFSYQVRIRPAVFVSSGLALELMAWATLSYFTVKASRLNPAETVKNE